MNVLYVGAWYRVGSYLLWQSSGGNVLARCSLAVADSLENMSTSSRNRTKFTVAVLRCLLFSQLSVTITGVTSWSQSREVHALYTLSNFRHGGDHVSAKRSVAKDVRGSVSRPKTPVNLDMFYSWTFRPILPPIEYSVRSFTAWARSLFRNICCITIISIVQSPSVSCTQCVTNRILYQSTAENKRTFTVRMYGCVVD